MPESKIPEKTAQRIWEAILKNLHPIHSQDIAQTAQNLKQAHAILFSDNIPEPLSE